MGDAHMDVMDRLAGLAAAAPLAALRRQRPDVVRHTQGSDTAIFAPRDDGGFSRAERAAAALRIAILLRDAALQAHYRARLAELDADGLLSAAVNAGSSADRRFGEILAHVDRVTVNPDAATKEHIDALLAAGLSPHGVVSLSQVIAYVHFQSRVLAGLRMLRNAS